jgi:nicotinamide mononucleotide transporter
VVVRKEETVTHPRPLPVREGRDYSQGDDSAAELSTPLPVSSIPYKEGLRMGLLALFLWAVIYWLLVTFTNSNVPLADAFTTALSIVGIWALAHKYLEQWFIWIAVDVVTCVLYFYKDIPFKASLYGLYVVIAILGWFKWRRMMKEES